MRNFLSAFIKGFLFYIIQIHSGRRSAVIDIHIFDSWWHEMVACFRVTFLINHPVQSKAEN